ncbi:MAG: SRPBCC family protein [Anaerolineaceae bacterium]|nr:SRPBCC family protein [Anaerolineaceae bacterium]
MAKFEREVEIDAPIENAWAVLTDPMHWPKWFPFMHSVSNIQPLAQGVVINWNSGDKNGIATVTIFDPEKELEILTNLEGDEDRHNFTLRRNGGFFGLNADEVKIEYKLDTLSGGGILGRFVSGGNPRDMLRVKNTTNALRRLIEAQYPRA